MKIVQLIYKSVNGLQPMPLGDAEVAAEAIVVLAFGARGLIGDANRYQELRDAFPKAHILMASTAGEIAGTQVYDDTMVAAAIQLEHTKVDVANVNIRDFANSHAAGASIGGMLLQDDLAFVLLISDGHLVNGSELVKGIHTVIPDRIPVTGGLAGDGARFQSTLVGINEPPSEGNIIALGFYGDRFVVGHGSRGGWDIFGPSRLVTKSKANVLYELDGRNALDLYKEYLGDYAKELPSSGLLFPLSLQDPETSESVVRTILSIDESAKSMTFAGDITEGQYASFMKANFDKLVDGSQLAAESTLVHLGNFKPQLALLISCVGRKLVLGPRIEEEVEIVEEVFGSSVPMIGFYSYGEISPFNPQTKCALHNQTMTITAIAER